MFDTEFAAVSDDELVAAIEDGVRAEAAAAARRLAAIAELTRRRVDDDDPRALWACDPWDSAAAEVAAAMSIGQRSASGQMRIAAALRDRLPRLAALHMKGEVCSRVVSAITWGTHLVEDPEALERIDTALAKRAGRWGRWGKDKLRDAIDMWVTRYDPDAVRRAKANLRGLDVTIGSCEDDAETTAVWGRLRATDAAVMKKRLAAMVDGVCGADPRNMGERRADAMGALGYGILHLRCTCGSPTCPAATGRPTKSNVVIRVIADQAAVDEAAREAVAQQPAPAAEQPAPAAEQPAPTPPRPTASPALLLGRGVLPGPLLADAIRNGATIKPIGMPSDEAEKGYRPSAELAEWVRMRDLFCRFPGCDVSAEYCDLDHAKPWPFGPTHASNLNCKCRKHHLLKTFWTGIGGWADVQLPDGTVIWTSPSGRQYTSLPGSRLFFPNWNITTADLPPPTTQPPPAGDRGLMMPSRQRTRAAEDIARIKAERALGDADPPPF